MSLVKAIEGGASVSDLRVLVRWGASVYIYMDAYTGIPLLQAACGAGRLDIVKYFVEECGVDVNQESTRGCTAFKFACENEHADVALYLVSHQNFDPFAGDCGGFSQIWACYNARPRGFLDVAIVFLAKQGPDGKTWDVNTRGWSGHTVLMFSGFRDMTSLLLARGANPLFVCERGDNAFVYLKEMRFDALMSEQHALHLFNSPADALVHRERHASHCHNLNFLYVASAVLVLRGCAKSKRKGPAGRLPGDLVRSMAGYLI